VDRLTGRVAERCYEISLGQTITASIERGDQGLLLLGPPSSGSFILVTVVHAVPLETASQEGQVGSLGLDGVLFVICK
jgi:hypothetical protein